MSVGQMVCHLHDCFCVPLGKRAISKPPKVPPIPRPLFKWLALSFPAKWPQGVPTPPELDSRIGCTQPTNFGSDRAALLVELNTFMSFAGPWSAHPIFGPMTASEWMRWGYLHIDHHLRQFGR
jgi:hypothetical protein